MNDTKRSAVSDFLGVHKTGRVRKTRVIYWQKIWEPPTELMVTGKADKAGFPTEQSLAWKQ